MKKCAKCGKENIDGATFCAECGFKLDSTLNNSQSNSNGTASADSSISVGSNSNGTASADGSISLGSNSKGPIRSLKERKNNGMRMWCCYVPVILFIGFIVVAVVYHDAAEIFPVSYGHTYEYFDVDGDGRLSLDEASQVNPNIPDSNLTEYFNEADTNKNGYLKGHEYELFYDDIDFYRRYYTDSSFDSDKYKYSTSNDY